MKKFFLISVLMVALPVSLTAQTDDLYFVSKKKRTETVTPKNVTPQREVTYSGSNRNVDEYNRMRSKYEVIDNDSTSDIIDFNGVQGIYPDSIVSETEDFALTKHMQRFDDYDISTNEAFWAGYRAGRDDWGWTSPWYYRRYGWYDPWYYGSSWCWYDPWYYGYYGWRSWYWNDPWYYGYGYWNDPWYYRPYYYSYHYPVYYDHYYYGGGGGRHYAHTGNSGSINMRGGSRVVSHSSGGGSSVRGGRYGYGGTSSHESSLRNRTVGVNNAARTSSGRIGSSSRSTGTFNGGGTYRGSSSSSGSSGSFSGGSRMGGGSSGGGGGSVSRSSGGGGGGGGARGGRR